MTEPLKVGDHIAVWWSTGVKRGDDNIARVLEVLPYRGPFDGTNGNPHCLYILRLTADGPKKGRIDMSVFKGHVPDVVDMAGTL